MTNYLTAIPGTDPIPQLETNTPAMGGPGGVMNSQAQALLNRISYLSFYDISGGCVGKPANSAVILTFKAVRPFQLPSNIPGSTAAANTAATGTTVFILSKNGTGFGTLTFSAAGTTGVFSSSSVNFVAGDILLVTAPSTADTALADIGFVLAGVLQ